MPVPSPAIADIETEWREPSVAPRKPWLVTSTMPPMPAEAEAPPDLVTPLTPSAGFLGLARVPFQHVDARHVGIEQIEIGKVAGEQRRIGESGEFVLRRGARHGDGALGQRIDAVALDVVGRDRRLLVADQHAQADVVAFGALRFLDRAVAHVDRQRHRAHRDRIGLVGAGAPRRGDEAVGEIGEGGLIEERGHLGWQSVYADGRPQRQGARCAEQARFQAGNESSPAATGGRLLPRSALNRRILSNLAAPATTRQSCAAWPRATPAFNQAP